MGATGPLSKLSTRWNASFHGGSCSDAETLTAWLCAGAQDALAIPSEAVEIAASYSHPLGGGALDPGAPVTLRFTGRFECTSCGKGVKKLFDGYCFPCLRGKAEADQCVMNPHQCHFLEGTCREPAWGLAHCYQPHFVYLSFTDKYKVGITRAGQVPTRWIDQGATAACLLARTGSRHQAGVIEKILSGVVSDRSHWSKMLQAANARPDPAEFAARRAEVLSYLHAHPAVVAAEHLPDRPPEAGGGKASLEFVENPRLAFLSYPLPRGMPAKIASSSFDKVPEVGGELMGVKGQYLVFPSGVFNVRRHEGYVTEAP